MMSRLAVLMILMALLTSCTKPSASVPSAALSPPPASTPLAKSGIHGHVSEVVLAGVQMPGSNATPTPHNAVNRRVEVRDGARVLAVTTTDGNGDFHVDLAPGTYQLVCGDQKEVKVVAGQYATVELRNVVSLP